ERGDYLCIVGENGSGKSTLVRALLGLKAPAAGKITFGDGLHQNEIGYLPQQTGIQRDFPASVEEIVRSGCLNRPGLPFYTRADRRRAAECIEKLALTGLESRSYRTLSGGQQQRVLLARALCATRRLLLLDEPVTGLDPVAQEQMYELLTDLNRTESVTVVMVSHDVRCAARHASHILHLSEDGAFFGTVDAYRESAQGQRFLGDHDHD
ncbi:MAG: ATP-binding cassette domain-containing protein, partial [Clostridia bacterium]|nr:ATP-binding cassette domain-containing protein [Clostridia bacterium]